MSTSTSISLIVGRMWTRVMVVLATLEQVTEAPAVVLICRCDSGAVVGDVDATWVLCGVDVSTTSAKEPFE